jgi:hypothetical protein
MANLSTCYIERLMQCVTAVQRIRHKPVKKCIYNAPSAEPDPLIYFVIEHGNLFVAAVKLCCPALIAAAPLKLPHACSFGNVDLCAGLGSVVHYLVCSPSRPQ